MIGGESPSTGSGAGYRTMVGVLRQAQQPVVEAFIKAILRYGLLKDIVNAILEKCLNLKMSLLTADSQGFEYVYIWNGF